MLLILLLFVCLPLSFVAAGPPKSCTAITATKRDDYYGSSDSTTSVYLNLKLFQFGNTTWIYVSNFSYTDSSYGAMPDQICANSPFGITDAGDPQKCGAYYNTTFAFSIEEPAFYLHAHFPHSLYEVYYGYADDGTFSFGDSLFTPETPTYSYTTSNYKYSITETQTCTSFVAAPEVVGALSPKCKSFESETVVINSDGSISATSNGTYSFYSGNNMTVAANFSGYADDYFVMFWTNGQPCESKWKHCNIEIESGDVKIIVSSAIVKQVDTEVVGNSIPLVGRILIRDNQTLMKEGTPYTPSNSCLSTSYKFGDNQIANNKFCCTEFEKA